MLKCGISHTDLLHMIIIKIVFVYFHTGEFRLNQLNLMFDVGSFEMQEYVYVLIHLPLDKMAAILADYNFKYIF